MKNIDVLSVKVVREKEVPFAEDLKFNSSTKVGEFLINYIGDNDREAIVVLLLDAQLNINAVHTVAIGTLSEVATHPREVFKLAVLKNAASIILAHNHPGCSMIPSEADIQLTKKMVEVGEL